MKSYPNDYLKYWRVIRQYAKIKYELSQCDLDMLLFLYSEGYFRASKFREYDALLAWDKERFSRLIEQGWIEVFRKANTNGGKAAIYKLPIKTTRMVQNIYKKLNGEEIPTSLSGNPMFMKNVSYTDKVYRNMILEMNKVIKQQLRRTRE
jgi:hypothetical protein